MVFNRNSEVGVIGCLVYAPAETLRKCQLEPKHFYLEGHQKLWAKALEDGDSFRMSPSDLLDYDVKPTALGDYANALEADLGIYEAGVRQAWTARQAEAITARIAAAQHDGDFERMRSLAEELATLGADSTEVDISFGKSDIYRLAVEDIAASQSGGEQIPWPWADFRNRLDGLVPGMAALFAADDGAGKTVFAEQCAWHWAQCGLRVGYYHLELSGTMMRRRVYAREGQVPMWKMTRGDSLDDEAQRRIHGVADKWHNLKGELTYVSCPGWTAKQITRHADALGFDVIIVDYLNQLTIDGEEYDARPKAQLELRNWAVRKHKYLMVLAQLRKSGKDGEPTKQDIFGGSGISNYSNLVVLMWRNDAESKETTRIGGQLVTLAEAGAKSSGVNFKVAKHTIGAPVAPFKMRFVGPQFCYIPFDVSRTELEVGDNLAPWYKKGSMGDD